MELCESNEELQISIIELHNACQIMKLFKSYIETHNWLINFQNISMYL